MRSMRSVVRRFAGRSGHRAIAAALAAVAVGGVVMTTGPASAAPTVTVNFATQAIAQASWSKSIANFQKEYPNIRINVRYLPGDYGSLIRTQIRAGNIPDVFYVAPGNGAGQSVLPYVYQKGIVMDLSGESWVKRIPDFVKPMVSTSQGVYAWPGDINLQALWYNKPGLAKVGVNKAPATFGELLKTCKTISAAGKTPIALATVPAVNAFSLLGLNAAALDGISPKFMKARKKGQTTFAASGPWKKAAQRVVLMRDSGCFSKGVAATTNQAVFGQLASGQALMFAGASQILNGVFPLITDKSAVDFKGVPFPGDKGGKGGVMVTPNDGLAVSEKTKVKQAALAFVKYMARPKEALTFASANGNADLVGFSKGHVPGFMGGLRHAIHAGQTVINPASVWPNPSARETIGAGTVGLLTGQKKPDQVLADADRAYDGN